MKTLGVELRVNLNCRNKENRIEHRGHNTRLIDGNERNEQ